MGKGASYERMICKQLSLWVTHGALEDCFWRSAMSGGRATVAYRKGVIVRQAGDIAAVSPEGQALCAYAFIELKHYRKLDIEAFLLKRKGKLTRFWRTALQEARKHKLEPLLIARQNFTPDLIITRPNALRKLIGKPPKGMMLQVKRTSAPCDIYLLKDVLACPFKLDT